MTPVDRDLLRACVAEARFAPSVHNIQPTRWRLAGSTVQVLGDVRRKLPVADPSGRDVAISHGAAIEGFHLALRQRGLALGEMRRLAQSAPDAAGLLPVAELTVEPLHAIHGSMLKAAISRRSSWRGAFRRTDQHEAAHLERLAAAWPDLMLVTDRDAITAIARLNDAASLHFLRDPRHRAELLSWMRLSRSDPNYHRDGLNAEAMCLGAIEAWGAGLALERLFEPLDRLGLAAILVSESAKTRSAAAVALLHRPAGENALLTGRAFYRAWLAIEDAGMSACPMSVLADWDEAHAALLRRHPLPADRQLVSVLRIGAPAGTPSAKRARLPVDELLV